MKALHVLLAIVLVGCSGGSTGLASPTPPTSLEVVTPSPSATPAPLMNGLPTTFAPCAGAAKTVKRAAYNCLRDWKPQMEKYPGKVVYHFSPSITASEKAAIREATEFALVRAEGYINTAGFAPEFHLFYNMDDWKACQKLLKSWRGTAEEPLAWEELCTLQGRGGRTLGSSIPKSLGVAISTPRATAQASDFSFHTYQVLPAEIVATMIFAVGETRLRRQASVIYVAPLWVEYAASMAAGRAAGIQLRGDSLTRYDLTQLPAPGRVTWQPTVSDPRFGPWPATDWASLSSENPWQYSIMDRASQFMTAMFGPDWIQQTLYPIMLKYSARRAMFNNDFTADQVTAAFREEANAVAQEIWGGTWGELEALIDAYATREFKSLGLTGLE